MTTTTTETNTYHVLKTGISLPRIPARAPGHPDPLGLSTLADTIALRGDELEVTPAYVEATRDRWGESWAEDLSDEAQLARWHELRFGQGPRPQWLQTELDQAAAEAAETRRIEQIRESARYGRGRTPDFEKRAN